jgi:hypothetical protein
MATRVLRILTFLAAIAGIGFGIAPHGAMASSLPNLTSSVATPSLITKADYWHHYCKFHDCTGLNVYGVPPVAVVPLSPPVVAVVPVRPVSCGEFHYWDGERCVDARYNRPYLGPR